MKWRTATEQNNAGFEVQRRNGAEWSALGFVEGHGTTNAPQEYHFTDAQAAAGKNIYRLKQLDRDGKFVYSNEVEVVVGLSAADYALSQNYPNPFNPVTTFSYAVRQRQHVQISVFNLLGQEVATLVNGQVEPDVLQHVRFNAAQLSSGIYYYSLRTADRHEIRKFILMK
ncbi:MAG: T9SS type A sorting domain-containing protein [Bacteroidetes bacterium]|nr:T9SS type A sorting domain-containing protein [Bacteroidota bacterium]